MQTDSSRENRTLNSFADSFAVATTLLAGFVVSATGITIASPALGVAGLLILFGGAGLLGRWLV